MTVNKSFGANGLLMKSFSLLAANVDISAPATIFMTSSVIRWSY